MLTQKERAFVDWLGFRAQADGLSRIAGQIWAVLILSDGPVSGSALADMLKISKASVSTNTRNLEALDIIERRAVAGERQDYFAMRENPYRTFVQSQIKRFRESLEQVRSAKQNIEGEPAQRKLEHLEAFWGLCVESGNRLLESIDAADMNAEEAA